VNKIKICVLRECIVFVKNLNSILKGCVAVNRTLKGMKHKLQKSSEGENEARHKRKKVVAERMRRDEILKLSFILLIAQCSRAIFFKVGHDEKRKTPKKISLFFVGDAMGCFQKLFVFRVLFHFIKHKF
jgi:hypothetical protein